MITQPFNSFDDNSVDSPYSLSSNSSSSDSPSSHTKPFYALNLMRLLTATVLVSGALLDTTAAWAETRSHTAPTESTDPAAAETTILRPDTALTHQGSPPLPSAPPAPAVPEPVHSSAAALQLPDSLQRSDSLPILEESVAPIEAPPLGAIAPPELIPPTQFSHQSSESHLAQDSSGTVGDTYAPNQLRRNLLIDPVTAQPRPRRLSAPASTLGTPTAFGANFGNLFLGGSITNRARGGDQADGSAVVGFGLGDSRRNVGLEVSVGIISLSDSGGRDTVAGSGAVGFKLHRILPENIGIAVGWENAFAWGDAQQADSSVYGVISRAFALQPNNPDNPLPLVLSVGIGGGRFRSESAIEDDENTLGVFASAGLRVIPELSFIANWTGQDLNVGVSAAPFRRVPLTFTVGLADLTGSAGDGVRFSASLGYGFSFRWPF